MGAARRGHTLVEMAMSLALFATIAGGVFALARDSEATFQSSLRATHASRLCSQALRRIADDLELADPATLAISTVGADGDALSLRLPLSVAAGVVTWGARSKQAGAWFEFANASLEYRIQPAAAGRARLQLVRRVVDGAGLALAADEVIADEVDEPDATLGKALVVARNGRLVTISFRVRLSRDADRGDAGEDLVKSQQATIRLRNP